MIQELQASNFSPLLNQVFSLQFGNEPALEAELITVQEKNGYTPLSRKPFSIIFRANQQQQYYPQNIAKLHHPEMGELELFFVPVGFDGTGILYEAAFS